MKNNVYECCLDLNSLFVRESKNAIMRFEIDLGHKIDVLHLSYVYDLALCIIASDYTLVYKEYSSKLYDLLMRV